jgi:4-carboxymuconolactone decarboxylase
MAKAYDFLHATNEILTGRGVELPLPGQSRTTPDTRLAQGSAVQKQIFGAERVDTMQATAAADEKHFQQYLSANCFGDHLTRTGIDLAHRELLTFAVLVGLGGADAQVKAHVTGNLNVGNDRVRLLSVLTVLVPFIGYPRTLNGLAALDEITLR